MAKIDFINDRWVFKCTWAERALPKQKGFFWDAENLQWFTTNISHVSKAKEYLSPESLEIFFALSGEKDLPVNKPTDTRLFNYQIEAACFLQKYSGVINGDEAGLGKTPETIAAIAASRPHLPKDFILALIICPPFLAYNWEKEIKKWDSQANVQILKHRGQEVTDGTDYVILPDSNLVVVLQQKLMSKSFYWGVVDESHRFKNPKAKRTQVLFGEFKSAVFKGDALLNQCYRKVLLSGTPIPNRPIEIWAQIYAIAPYAIDFMDYYAFARRYCGAFQDHYGYNVSGATNQDELKERLNKIMIRRLKADVLKELPSKTKIVLAIEPKGDEIKALAYEKPFKSKFKITSLMTESEFYQATNQALGALAEARKNLSLLKVKHAIDFIENFFEGNPKEPLVVFGWHKDALKMLANYFPGNAIITGETPMIDRHKLVERFQRGDLRIIFANIQAAGVGLTLTRSSHVLFLEFSWVPSENDQAIDRTHRVGQVNPVSAYFLVYKDSLDEYVFEAQRYKQQVIDQII
jgi:SWI/SNF-related matrix-associated actin-dependent regulator 1 of chromatin subfamily A